MAFLDMKAHIGVEADSGLVAHITIATAANVNDVSQGHDLPHGEQAVCSLTHTLPGCSKATEATWVGWHVSMRPGKRRALDKQTALGALLGQAEQLGASVRAKVEHPLRVVKCESDAPRSDTVAGPRIRRNSSRCLRWAICGWREDGLFRERRAECACSLDRGSTA